MIWPTVGWGIGVTFNYFGVYKFNHTAENEYQKLTGNRHGVYKLTCWQNDGHY
ncbi:2TM domain-containing protein [Ginsengibacter hankyongi]|uniref:2TM domain-containing protein n=1 Tax=Ginsengibacter hankyongi TaxID=2607284 RepID=A0A5J5IH16_9BACT|nr:2TM domain-containing protein [Ginsengibacter hankyongi]